MLQNIDRVADLDVMRPGVEIIHQSIVRTLERTCRARSSEGWRLISGNLTSRWLSAQMILERIGRGNLRHHRRD